MKKEKQVRSYKRRTKSGKIITVKAHTAKYDAADEKAKGTSKKEGAGKELEERKKKSTKLEIPLNKEEEKEVLDEVKGVEVSKMDGASLTRDAKLPKGITIKGSWREISDAGTKGIGHSSWSSKADIFEATLSDGRKVTLHRTYGPAGETKVSYSSGESAKKPTEKKTPKKVRSVDSSTNGSTPKKKSEGKETEKISASASSPAFTAAEFKEWYRGTGSAADKKVAKALRAQLGRSGYRKLEDEAIDGYSSRGHLSMFKRVNGGSSPSVKSVVASGKKGSNDISTKTSSQGISGQYAKITNKSLQRKITNYVQEATNWEHSEGAKDYTWKDTLRALADPGEKSVRSGVDKMIAKALSKAKKPTLSKNMDENRSNASGSDEGV